MIQDVRSAARDLPAGSRLPSVRELMARHSASPVTVQRAIAQLAAEGLVDPRPGRGTFVAERSAAGSAHVPDLSWQQVALGGGAVDAGGMDELLALPRSGAIPLSTGYLSADLQPTDALGAALARAARRPGAWDRTPVEGLHELRSWFAVQAGPDWRPHDLVVCSGGQAALGLAFRALGVPGEPVVVESPTYLGALASARSAGLRPVPVPADADGIRPDLLADTLARTGARVVYLQPLFANPTGAVLAAERRAEVLEAVRAAGAFLIEDDWARDLAIDLDPLPAPLSREDADGHVVHLRSITKVAAPGLRVAAIGARGAAGARLRAARVVDDFFVSGPLQHAALDFVSSPAWNRHKRRLRAELAVRRGALLAALERHTPQLGVTLVPRGGLHVWVRLPEELDDAQVVAAAAAAGVVVSGGRRLHAGEAPGPFLRLTYAGAAPAELAEGVERLARTLPT